MITTDDIAIGRFVRYDGRQEIVLPAMQPSRRTALFVAIALLIVCGGWLLGGRALLASIRSRIAMERLMEASPQRWPAARFTALKGGLRSQAASEMRGSDEDPVFQARVADVVRLSSATPEAVGASAVARVMARDWRTAMRSLGQAVVAHPEDASLWSDLAAAHYERSVAVDDVEGLLPALVAADRSRRIDPTNANALFNRALILEQLGLHTMAADAWRACLETDDPVVGIEARRRLEASEPESWSSAKPELERAAEAGDMSSVERIVATFPQDARGYGEFFALTNWANAYLEGDQAAAAKNLRIARAAGAALRPRGETLLAEAVAAIDTATAEKALRTLAVAQQNYSRGRRAFSEEGYVDGERLLNDAAAGFAQERSPMALVARAYAASVSFEKSRSPDVHRTLSALAAEARAHPGYRSLLAVILWVDGRCAIFHGRWNEAVDALRASRAIYFELGESKNAGAMDGFLAEVLDRVGRPDLAWPHWLSALRLVSAKENLYRLQEAIAGGVRMAMRTGDWNLAASLLDIELSVASELRKPLFNADAFRRLYIVENHRKQMASRDIALTRARINAAQIQEERQSPLAEIDQAEALVTMQSNPDRAVVLFTRALEFAASSDQRIFMTDLRWNRGRAHLAAGNKEAAKEDFTAGIEELEKQRGRIDDPELRARFFDASEGLFDDTVALLADRGDAAAAFQYADRAKARALLEIDDSAAVPAPVLTPIALADRLPDAALVEFAVLDHDVIVFCVRDGIVKMHHLPITADGLRKRIEVLRGLFARGEAERIRLAAGELYEILFGAVSDQIATAKLLVIVPDDDLQRVPFAALWERTTGQYLVQSHRIAIAPSAAVIARRTAPMRAQRSVLLIGNATGNEEESLGNLPNVNDEIASLQRVYRSSRVLFGPEASKARFTAEVPSFDVIHFAGHGLSDEESLTASLLLARGGNDSGRLYTSDIARFRLPRAPLVVLAACGTLRGKVGGVEGMPSLARSFLAAGASTVVGTLWETNDALSVELVTSFHRSIAANASPAEALRNAQLEAIARGGVAANPKNWAPYVIYGTTP